jgi:hypothetical protein
MNFDILQNFTVNLKIPTKANQMSWEAMLV